MSVDVEGAEYEIMKVFPFNKYKVYSLTIEHGGNGQLKHDIRNLMKENGYIIYKELRWDDVFILPELLEKQCVNSFDFFDTLAHRYYVDENSIFNLVAKMHNLENFLEIRKQTEMMTEGILKDIYEKIYEIKPEWKILDLENLEFELEKKYLLPNHRMINKIKQQKNPLIISDTFYSHEQLRLLAKHFDITNAEIFVSRSGKRDGWIYKKLQEKYIIVGHYGDNQHSDIVNAKLNDINAELILDRHFVDLEKKMYVSKLHALSFMTRTCRLLSNNMEISLIFMMNLLMAELLHRIIKELSIKNLLLTQRDCCHLEKIFKIFYPEINAKELYTSRLAFEKHSPSFIEYYKKCVKHDCVIFDMNGTGYSTYNFCKKNNITLTKNSKLIFGK